MYHMEPVNIYPGDGLFAYMDYACLCANNVYNVTNFIIRNLMTGLKKDALSITKNEKDVILSVEDGVRKANDAALKRYRNAVAKIRNDRSLTAEQKEEKLKKVKLASYEMPTAEKWFAGYNIIDAVLKFRDDPDYRSHQSHLVQAAIRECCDAWKSRFAQPEGGNGTGRPGIPGYRRSGGRSTAVLDSTACRKRAGGLLLSGARLPGSSGKCTPFIRTAGMPHASKDKLVQLRIVPYFGGYQLQVITDDGLKEEDILPDAAQAVRADGTAAGVMMLDPDLDNFAAITDNRGNVPIVIKGGAVKARNQWYNKRMAFLRGEQMKGHETKGRTFPQTKRMRALSRRRDAFMRDTFYKYAHYICRLMADRGLEYLVVGHNPGQKQGIRLGKKTDQAFVSVPFAEFRSILLCVCAQYGILMVEQEESYTSKACFAARDPIPVYGEEGDDVPSFSGKRVKRGLYRQDDGNVLNADVNGGLNTGRKFDERIFPEGMDMGYIYRTVKAVTYKGVLEDSRARRKKAAGAA